jgi:tetratricopeptide (TPR) repeat protein
VAEKGARVRVVRKVFWEYSDLMKAIHAPRIALSALVLSAALAGCASNTRTLDVAAEYYNLGNAYFELGQYEKAVTYYTKSLDFNPGLANANLNLALALIQLKKPSEAQEILSKLLSGDEENVTVMTALGWALHAGGKDVEALAQYDKIIELSPENRDAVYNSGLILWKLDRQPDALERFKKLLIISPDDNDALFSVGALLLSLEDPKSASDSLERYLQKKPEDVDALFLLAESRTELEKYSQALSTYEKIVVLNPKEARAWFGKARLLLTVIEDPDKGLSALKQALELGFHDMGAVKTLLESTGLQSRSDVESALKARNMLPKAEDNGAGAAE